MRNTHNFRGNQRHDRKRARKAFVDKSLRRRRRCATPAAKREGVARCASLPDRTETRKMGRTRDRKIVIDARSGVGGQYTRKVGFLPPALPSSCPHPGFILDSSWLHPGFVLASSWLRPGCVCLREQAKNKRKGPEVRAYRAMNKTRRRNLGPKRRDMHQAYTTCVREHPCFSSYQEGLPW